VDYPDFSSDTCKHNVYYFFADLAGFIAAQILDPAMYLGGLALKKIAGLVGSALGMTKTIDKVSDAAKLTAVVDEVGALKRVVLLDEFKTVRKVLFDNIDDVAKAQDMARGANKALIKLGPKADILKNADALDFLGKHSDECDSILDTLANTGVSGKPTFRPPEKVLEDFSSCEKNFDSFLDTKFNKWADSKQMVSDLENHGKFLTDNGFMKAGDNFEDVCGNSFKNADEYFIVEHPSPAYSKKYDTSYFVSYTKAGVDSGGEFGLMVMCNKSGEIVDAGRRYSHQIKNWPNIPLQKGI